MFPTLPSRVFQQAQREATCMPVVDVKRHHRSLSDFTTCGEGDLFSLSVYFQQLLGSLESISHLASFLQAHRLRPLGLSVSASNIT